MFIHIGPKGDIRWRLARATAASKVVGWEVGGGVGGSAATLNCACNQLAKGVAHRRGTGGNRWRGSNAL